MRRRNQRGFTLAELLIVIAILAILVAIAVPVFTSQLQKARETADASNLRTALSLGAANYGLSGCVVSSCPGGACAHSKGAAIGGYFDPESGTVVACGAVSEGYNQAQQSIDLDPSDAELGKKDSAAGSCVVYIRPPLAGSTQVQAIWFPLFTSA